MSDPKPFRTACSMLVCDGNQRVLVVYEGDPHIRGKINLPGGHVEPGEDLATCAERECKEETGLIVRVSHLLGVYVQPGGINFVFIGSSEETAFIPGDDILECQWLSANDILSLPDTQFLRPKKMRQILSDLMAGKHYPLNILCEVGAEPWE